MSKINGTDVSTLNKEWAGEEHQVERECVLYRLMTIEKKSTSLGYFGSRNCTLCGLSTPYGSRKYGPVEWSIDIHHYIEFHGHRPTDDEMQAINFSFEEIKQRQENEIRKAQFGKNCDK